MQIKVYYKKITFFFLQTTRCKMSGAIAKNKKDFYIGIHEISLIVFDY